VGLLVKTTLKNCSGSRNISIVGFVYTSAAGNKAVAGWIEIKRKPRGGSRGANDTQLFRLLDQDEEVSCS
jgi:hypothetical protein